MITAKCDKCGVDVYLPSNYNGTFSSNRTNGKDLCEKCKREWYIIQDNLQTQIFKAWMSGNIKFYENITPGKMTPEGYSNHDGSYYACPFCGKIYGDYEWPVGEQFDCTECGRKIIGH